MRVASSGRLSPGAEDRRSGVQSRDRRRSSVVEQPPCKRQVVCSIQTGGTNPFKHLCGSGRSWRGFRRLTCSRNQFVGSSGRFCSLLSAPVRSWLAHAGLTRPMADSITRVVAAASLKSHTQSTRVRLPMCGMGPPRRTAVHLDGFVLTGLPVQIHSHDRLLSLGSIPQRRTIPRGQ